MKTSVETSVIERLKEFLKYLELGQNVFEKRMGWGNGYIAHIKKSIGSDKLNDLINEYPLFNIEWLITGNGNMLKEEKQDNVLIAAEPVQQYKGNTSKYIQQLENENKRLATDNEQKNELLNNFLSGNIFIAKKENDYIESLNRISELERELKEFYKKKSNKLGDMDGGLGNVKIVKSKKGA